MNELKIFENTEFGQVRTVTIEDKIYFVASDVAKALGYAKPQNAISAHCKGTLKWGIPTNGGNQEMNIIPEGDIYRLVVKSELPSAEKFESWVFDEVLPTIRKQGSYMPEELSPQLQLLINMELKQKQLEVAVADTNARIDNIKEVVSLDSTAWRADTQNLLNKIAISLGGTSQFYRQLREASYELLDRRMGVSLQIRLTNKKRRMAEEGASKSKRESTTKLDVITDDKRLIEGYIAIVKEMAIKYGIADKKAV